MRAYPRATSGSGGVGAVRRASPGERLDRGAPGGDEALAQPRVDGDAHERRGEGDLVSDGDPQRAVAQRLVVHRQVGHDRRRAPGDRLERRPAEALQPRGHGECHRVGVQRVEPASSTCPST